MNIEQLVSEEMREAIRIDNGLKARVPADGPWDTVNYRHQYNTSRAYWNRGGPVMSRTLDIVIDGGISPVSCRIHYPDAERVSGLPSLIFFHGGGWVVGNLDTHDRMMRELAHRSGHVVLGVDYPLAPESRFPDSYEATLAVIRKILIDGHQYGLDPERVSLGGDSAGAHISLYCALSLRHQNLPALKSLVLIYGAFGLTDSASRRLYGKNSIGFSDSSMNYYIQALMGDGIDPKTAGYDLLANDLTGLPPSLITTCTLDLLRDDGIVLAELLNRTGVIHQLINYDGVLHGYLHMTEHVNAAAATLDRCAGWLNNHG